MKIIPFKAEHLECMDIRKHEEQLLIQYGAKHLEKAMAITGILDGRIVACGGVFPYGNGNSDIWLIPSIYVANSPIFLAKEVRKWLNKIQKDLSLNRMQSFCINDDLHDRWMSFLGFTKEGVMKKYSNGIDFAVWGKTWE